MNIKRTHTHSEVAQLLLTNNSPNGAYRMQTVIKQRLLHSI